MKKIIKYFKNLKKKKKYSQTDVYDAVYDNDIEFVRENIKNTNIMYDGYSLLNCAVLHSNIEIIKILLEDNRCNPTAKLNRSLVAAASIGNVEILSLLFNDYRVDKELVHLELLKKAIEKKKIEAIRFLLKDIDFNPFKNKNDLTGLALKDNFEEAAIEIVKNKYFDPSLNFDIDLDNAVYYESVALLKIILNNKKSDPSKDNNRLITYASEKGLNEIIDLLFENIKIKKTLHKDNPELFAALNKKTISNKLDNF